MVSPSTSLQKSSAELHVPSAYWESIAMSKDTLIVSASWMSKSAWSFPQPASTMRKGRRSAARSLRRKEMLFMVPPSGSALGSVDGARRSTSRTAYRGGRDGAVGRTPHRQGALLQKGSAAGRGGCQEGRPSGRGGRSYFQNISMPPPTISTPKPAARFQSPMGSGSWPEEM